MPANNLPRPWKNATLGVALAACLVHCSTSETVATREPTPNRTGGGGGGGAGGASTTGGGTTTGSSGAWGTGGTSGGASAGSGGTGGTTAGGGAGTGTGGIGPSRPQDAASDVVFSWPEGKPDAGGACKPGSYQGTFECLYMNGDAGPTFPVSGPISMKLVQSQQGEFLEVRDGVLDGTANIFFVFRADISGKLDCRTAKFDGRLENGTYSGFLIINGTFQGPLSSSYDRVNFAFTGGQWALAVDTVGGGCNGTWSARYMGPAD